MNSEDASTSQAANVLEDGDLELNIPNDEAEIRRLETPNKDGNKLIENSNLDEDSIPKIEFECSCCHMLEMVHYFGKNPNFVHGLQFHEDTYVMRDPFVPPPPRWKSKAEYFIALGAKCCKCQRVVCRDSACSFYYTRTFCLDCGRELMNEFSTEAQSKLRKQLSLKT